MRRHNDIRILEHSRRMNELIRDRDGLASSTSLDRTTASTATTAAAATTSNNSTTRSTFTASGRTAGGIAGGGR